ncbi:MAG: hypothetical protein ACLFN0_05050 [Thermovirgaceae bacterium]
MGLRRKWRYPGNPSVDGGRFQRAYLRVHHDHARAAKPAAEAIGVDDEGHILNLF